MKNKQHTYILKAFVKSKIPEALHDAPGWMALDSVLGGYCTRLLGREDAVALPAGEIITAQDRAAASAQIAQATGAEKDELVVYTRLAALVECVLRQYGKRLQHGAEAPGEFEGRKAK